MDLDRCPKCGAEWKGGDMCRNCRFVPIGVGLDKLPKKKKKRARRYVEPGSAQPLLLCSFLGLFAFGCYHYQPWKDDWELVRELAGQGRRHSLVGEWEVVKSIMVKRGATRLLGAKPVQKGTLKFTPKGGFALDLYQGKQKSSGTGKYVVSGQLVAVNNLQSETGNLLLPSKLKLKLSWSGPNTVIATDGSEAIYLRRRQTGSPIANLMQMGIRPGNAQAPGAMRGVISTLQKNIDEEDSGTEKP